MKPEDIVGNDPMYSKKPVIKWHTNTVGLYKETRTDYIKRVAKNIITKALGVINGRR